MGRSRPHSNEMTFPFLKVLMCGPLPGSSRGSAVAAAGVEGDGRDDSVAGVEYLVDYVLGSISNESA